MSTLLGAEGTTELLAFGARIGLKARWLQNRGEPTEHWDLFDGAIDRARRAGGAEEVTGRDLIERVVRPKRAARQAAEITKAQAVALGTALEDLEKGEALEPPWGDA